MARPTPTRLTLVERRCAAPDCNEVIPHTADARKKWHSEMCRQRVYRLKKSGRVTVVLPPDGRGGIRAELIARGYQEQLQQGTMTFEAAAVALGVTVRATQIAYRHNQDWLEKSVRNEDWEMTAKHRRQLALDLEPEARGHAERLRNGDEAAWADLDAAIDEMVERFAEFRIEHFRIEDPYSGEFVPYKVAPFHKRWIKHTLRAIFTGGKSMILSPPRHGKSELMGHFCVWLIIRRPNIRIGWVSTNGDIAKESLSAIKDALENNDSLLEAFLPAGETWRPPTRGGRPWESSKFTVATRTRGNFAKSPTFWAIGRDGKVLSKDVDVMVLDDVEDHESTVQPANREQTKKKYGTQFMSRKMRWTAVAVWGSRQHPDDLYSALLGDESFDCIVEQAHADTCTENPHDNAAHIDCMLFPDMNDYRWLMDQKSSMSAAGLGVLFDMVYQNKVRPEGFVYFVEDDIVHAYDQTRGLGLAGLPHGVPLVAGLDPADSGFQAAFLWAYTPEAGGKLWLVDLENTRGGGLEGALNVMQAWHRAYGLRHWVVEENGYQKAIRLSDQVRNWASSNSVVMEGHETYKNKWDKYFGVTAMKQWFPPSPAEPRMSLPVATPEAREKVALFKNQLVQFDGSNRNTRGHNSDVVMAAWFPQKVIRRWENEYLAAADEDGLTVETFTSYPDLDLSPINTAPWRVA